MFLEWIGWKDYELPKNRNLESVSAKNVILVTQHVCTRPPIPTGPTDHPPGPGAPLA
jgi:hypothetical protein